MIKKCVDTITDWLIGCEIVEETDKDLYSYALYSVLLTISPLLWAVGFGICMGCIGRSVTIIIPFVMIRKFSGGYHAKYSWLCLIESSLLLLLCIVLSFQIKLGWSLTFITVGAAVSLVCCSPIDNENRELDQEEYVHCKRMVAVLVFIFLLMALMLFGGRQYIYSVCTSIGVILSAGLQFPCIFKKFGKR